MLTRRIFRQLTDSILLESNINLSSRNSCISRCRSPLAIPDLHPRRPSISHPHRQPAVRHASSSSSTRWKSRQTSDRFSRASKVAGLKSRAAFKLLEIDARYRLFKPGQTVVDLGYAPGSWSQVAASKTSPGGRVVGIDLLPVQPPKGVSTIQGNFLSEAVRTEVRTYVLDPDRGRTGTGRLNNTEDEEEMDDGFILEDERGYVDMERHADLDLNPEPSLQTLPSTAAEETQPRQQRRAPTLADRDLAAGRVVDILLSDMSAPWPQTTSSWVHSVSNVYYRLHNTSGIPFKDHVGSMDLCFAALTFAFDTLKTGGSFICKFYMGGEDKALEARLRALFEKVIREKPESSRSESKEAYFIGLRRKESASREAVLGSKD